MSKVINIISNYNQESKNTAVLLKNILKDNGFLVPKGYSSHAELNVCIGGDGAFLRAIHRYNFPTIPFVGINTGHLGFFQEVAPNRMTDFVVKYLNNEYFTEEMSLVEAKICTNNKEFYLTGLNEIVIKNIKSKVVHLEIYIQDNFFEKFSGDGIIISTPVGSTAYNYSSGGSIIYPSLDTLQMKPLAPMTSNAYRSLTNSTVVPGDIPIKIKPELRYSNSTLIVNDGVEYTYDNIKEITMYISDRKIRRLCFSKDSYWINLRNKFL